MDQWVDFLQDRWYIVLAAIVVLLLVLKLVKTVVKWAIVLAIVAGLFYYGSAYKDDIKTIGDTIVDKVKDQAFSIMENEAESADYTAKPDGTFTIHTDSLRVDGKAGDQEAKVTFKGKSFTVKIDGAVKKFIDSAKNQAAVK